MYAEKVSLACGFNRILGGSTIQDILQLLKEGTHLHIPEEKAAIIRQNMQLFQVKCYLKTKHTNLELGVSATLADSLRGYEIIEFPVLIVHLIL